ncbi:MAG TPA: fasciclin domain-containing protein, partial [Sphingomicrobium sp.]|nr:fasciclin domain-containing protein [Sphingomicrobium sp.]
IEMLKTSLSFGLCAAALALGACSREDANNAATAQPSEAREAAGDQTIAASLNQSGRFFQAAKAVGLDATLAGPGPYTVLVPTDEAFGKVQGGALGDAANPQNRAEITRILTYHILPGVILAEDIGTAIDSGNGKAVLATMGGETLTATKEGDKIVLTDAGGGKATIVQADQKSSNGVVHQVDVVLAPPAQGQGAADQGAAATNGQ